MQAMARCMARWLVARSAVLTSFTTPAHTAAGLQCTSHPLVLESHPIELDSEDLHAFMETPNSAQLQAAVLEDEDELPMVMAQLIDDVAAAGKHVLSAETSNTIKAAGLANINEQLSDSSANLAAADCTTFTAASAAAKQQEFYDIFDSCGKSDVAGVDTADGERILDAAWGEVLEDPETAMMYAVLLARGSAC